jgi:hypothetical protein
MDGSRDNPYVVADSDDEAGGGAPPPKRKAGADGSAAGRPSGPKRATTEETLAQLWSAIRWEDRDRIVGLLHTLTPGGLLDETGQSPVHAALAKETTDMLRLVLEHGPPGMANLHGVRAPSPLMFAIKSSLALMQRRAKVQLLVEHGADTDALDEDSKNALEAIVQRYQNRVYSIADTLTFMVARGGFTTKTIRAIRGVPSKFELMSAVKGMTSNSAQALLEPSCHDPHFLERLAKLYAGRIPEFGGCANADRDAIIGSIIGRLQQLPPSTGKFAVFTAELRTKKQVSVKDGALQRAAWYVWTPAVMACALDDPGGQRVMPAARAALAENDFVATRYHERYLRLPGCELTNARLDTSDSAFDALPSHPDSNKKFTSIKEVKRKTVRSYAFSGQAQVKFLRKGSSFKEFFVVATFDVALLEAMRTPSIRTIDVGVWLYASQKTTHGAHAMALDVEDHGGIKLLTPFDSNYRGLQAIGHDEKSMFGGGFCQTWSRLHLETVAMGARDWTKHVLKLYSSGNRDARAKFKQDFGDPRYPVTRFLLCNLLRYRDAQEVAGYRLQARRCIKETNARHSGVFFLWLGDPTARTDPHRRPLLLRAFAAEVICALLPQQGNRSIGHYFNAARISPHELPEDEFDELVRAYRYETAHPDIPFAWTPGYRIGDRPEDGERGIDFVRACREQHARNLGDLDGAAFVSLNARAVNAQILKTGVAEAVQFGNERVAIGILLSVKSLGAEMIAGALQAEPTEANRRLVEILLDQGVRPAEPTMSENPTMRMFVDNLLDELPLRP